MELQPQALLWVTLILLSVSATTLLLRLQLAGTILLAGLRGFVQLLFLGWILAWVFARQDVLIAGALLVVMTVIATQAVTSRVTVRYRGVAIHSFLSLACGAWAFSFFAGNMILGADSWRKPEIILPFAGLLLGNSLTGISLGLAHWSSALHDHRARIETRMAHGASKWEAVQPILRKSVQTGMIPLLNSMSVAGLVSLPGMMTGQLLAGSDPTNAVRLQIAGLFLMTASTFVGIFVALYLGYRTMFNSLHQMARELPPRKGFSLLGIGSKT